MENPCLRSPLRYKSIRHQTSLIPPLVYFWLHFLIFSSSGSAVRPKYPLFAQNILFTVTVLGIHHHPAHAWALCSYPFEAGCCGVPHCDRENLLFYSCRTVGPRPLSTSIIKDLVLQPITAKALTLYGITCMLTFTH